MDNLNWRQTFVDELRTQINAHNARHPGQPIRATQMRHFYEVSRGNRFARVVWRDAATCEVSTGTRSGDEVHWRVAGEWHPASGTLSAAESAGALLQLLE
jgi:hypothetical protein